MLEVNRKSLFSYGFTRLLRLGLQASEQFRQAVDQSNCAEPLAIVDGGVAADDGSRSDVGRDAGLGGRYRAVAYRQVAGNANLPCEDDIFADRRRAGEAYLGAEKGIRPDR